MKLFVFFILIGFLFYSCGNNVSKEDTNQRNYSEVESFPMHTIKLELLNTNNELMTPRKIWVNDSLIIIQDGGHSEGFLSFYNRHTGNFIKGYGSIGEGPEDYILPRCVKIGDVIVIYSIVNEPSYLLLNNISTINIQKEKKSLNQSLLESSYLFPINDTMVISCANLSKEAQFLIQSNNDIIINNKFPDYFGDKVSDINLVTKVFDAFYDIIPSKDNILVAYKYYPIVDIISIPDFKIQRTFFEEKQKNMYRVNNNGVAEFDNPLLKYTFSYCTNQCAYLLYQNSTNEDLRERKTNPEIHVFDWNGNFIKRLLLDRPAYNIAVSDNDDELYVLSLDENLDPQIYKSKLY